MTCGGPRHRLNRKGGRDVEEAGRPQKATVRRRRERTFGIYFPFPEKADAVRCGRRDIQNPS